VPEGGPGDRGDSRVAAMQARARRVGGSLIPGRDRGPRINRSNVGGRPAFFAATLSLGRVYHDRSKL
jgi:hypothetical protein